MRRFSSASRSSCASSAAYRAVSATASTLSSHNARLTARSFSSCTIEPMRSKNSAVCCNNISKRASFLRCSSAK